MMKEILRFTNLLDSSKTAHGGGYDELEHSAMPELTAQLNDSLE